MAASDMHTATAAERRRLLTNLFTSPETETYVACKDAKVLEDTVQAGIQELTHSSFGSVNPRHVAAHANEVSNLLSRHAQTGKLEAFEKLKSDLERVAPPDNTTNLDSNSILTMLFSLSRNVLSSENPAQTPNIDLKHATSELSAPPSASIDSSLQDAYDEAWAESDSLSDWDATSDRSNTQNSNFEPDSPFEAGVWVAHPSLMHSTKNMKHKKAYDALKAKNLHRSAGPQSPRRTLKVPAAAQFPHLPIPYGASQEQYLDQLQPGDLVTQVLKGRTHLGSDGMGSKCYYEAVVARQSLEVILDRPDVLFDSKPASASLAACLRTCAPPSLSYVKPFSHTRHITHGALLRALQPFLTAAAQRAALVAWLAAVTNQAAVGGASGGNPGASVATGHGSGGAMHALQALSSAIPEELMCGAVPNPTVVALVAAIGEQLDLVDAAVHSLQDTLQQRQQGDAAARGVLLQTRLLVKPITKRLALLHEVFSATITWCMHAGRGSTRGGSGGSKSAESSTRTSASQSRVTQIVVDSLYERLLHDEQVSGRGGAVHRAIVLHLLTAALRPTLHGMHELIAEGSSCGPQDHLCLQSSLHSVPASSPHFWTSSLLIRSDGVATGSHSAASKSLNPKSPAKSPAKTGANHGNDSETVAHGDEGGVKGGATLGAAGGLGGSHVPRCLRPFVHGVASAAKAVALLREYSQSTRAALLDSEGELAAPSVFPRLLAVLTEQLQSPEAPLNPPDLGNDSPHKPGCLPHSALRQPQHHCMHLMQQASDLLADMHREQQSAEGALEGMMEQLASAITPEKSDVFGGGVMAIENGHRFTTDGLEGMSSPGNSPVKWSSPTKLPVLSPHNPGTALKDAQLRDHNENPIRVEEKVAWMSDKGLPEPPSQPPTQAPSQVPSVAGSTSLQARMQTEDGASLRQSTLPGSSTDTAASLRHWEEASAAAPPSTHGTHASTVAHTPGYGPHSFYPPRVSLPPTTKGGSTRVGSTPSEAPGSLVSACTDFQGTFHGRSFYRDGGVGPRVEDLGAAQSDIEGDAQAHVPLTEGAKEAFDALQAQRDQHSAQHAQHDGDNDEEGHGTDSSSDFSYRLDESDEEGDESAQEAKQLRAARKALQRARHAAQAKLKRKGGMPSHIPSPSEGPAGHHAPGLNSIPAHCANVVAVVHTTSDWDRVDSTLVAAAESGCPIPPVHVQDAAMHAPKLVRSVMQGMPPQEQQLKAALSNIAYMQHPGRLHKINATLPGCISMPAYMPVQGSSAVTERMQRVHESRTSAISLERPPAAAAEAPVGGVHWQLLSLHADAPPAQLLLHAALSQSLLQTTLLPRRQLSELILGPCGLKEELQRVRSVLLVGSAPLQLWVGKVAARLNAGMRVASSGDALSSAALLELDMMLRQHVCDYGLLTDGQLTERSIRLRLSNSSHRGLPPPLRKSGKPPLISRISPLEIHYSVKWPLNVIVSDTHIRTYQKLLPVLLQVHWAQHNLNDLSQLLQALPRPHLLHPLLRRAHGAVSAREGSFSIPAACVAALRMRHVLQAFTHTMFDTAMDAAWHALCASLDAAAHASATDPPTGGAHKTAAADHLGAVARAHDVYLTAMCRACWLPDDANSQVVSKNLHAILDTILLFCNVVKTALVVEGPPSNPPSRPGSSKQPSAAPQLPVEEAQLDKARRRRAAQVAMQLADQFDNTAAQLIVSLGKCNLKIAEGSEIMCLLESLQQDVFLGDDD